MRYYLNPSARSAAWKALALASVFAVSSVASSAHADPRVYSELADLSRALGEISSGLETSLTRDAVTVAEQLYVLEVRATRTLHAAANARFAAPEGRFTTMADARALIGRILRLQERVQDHTIEELDRALPGEPNRQLWSREGSDLYRPLFRLGTPDPNQPQPTSMQALDSMRQSFLTAGGSMSEIRSLGPRTLDTIDSGQLAEWVQLGEDRIRFTTAGAKHPVIGNGSSVRGAGSMKIFRNADGEIILAVVSNSSGNYKPGPGSTEGVVNVLRSLGIPDSHILVTSVIPSDPSLVKLLMKARGEPRERIQARVARVSDQARQIRAWERNISRAHDRQLNAWVRTGRMPADRGRHRSAEGMRTQRALTARDGTIRALPILGGVGRQGGGRFR